MSGKEVGMAMRPLTFPLRKLFTFVLLVLSLPLGSLLTPSAAAENTITVGSKNFMESRLLAELFAQLIESRTHLTVTRRLGLAGTQVCFEALRTGGIDLYPEYTGTGLVTILGEAPMNEPSAVLNQVRAQRLELDGLLLGFQFQFLAGRDFLGGRDKQYRAVLTHTQSLDLQDDVQSLVPGHVFEPQGQVAAYRVADHHVQTGEIRQDL